MPTHSSALAQSSDQPELPKSFDELIADLNTKGVMRQIDAQLTLGHRIGHMIARDREIAAGLLWTFRAKAPTNIERIITRKPAILAEQGELHRHETAYDHLHVISDDTAPQSAEPAPIAIINDHVRLSVLMSVMKILMMSDGEDYQDFVRFRDSFLHQMYEEMSASDKKQKELQTAVRKRSVLPAVLAPEQAQQPEGANAAPADQLPSESSSSKVPYLTYADYVSRLEDSILQKSRRSETAAE